MPTHLTIITPERSDHTMSASHAKRAAVSRTPTSKARLRAANRALPITLIPADDENNPEAQALIPLAPDHTYRIVLMRKLRAEKSSSGRLYCLLMDESDGVWLTAAEVEALGAALPLIRRLRDSLLKDYAERSCAHCGTYLTDAAAEADDDAA